MGMFDKDKEFGLDATDAFQIGERFALYGATRGEKNIETKVGLAAKTTMIVRRLDSADHPIGDTFEVTTLASAIGDKADQAEPSDFPCLVELRHVDSTNFGVKALVLQWVGELNDPLDDVLPSADATIGTRKRPAGSRA